MTAKKPRHFKLLAGTARADRGASEGTMFPPLDAVPPAPDFLPNSHAAREWDRLAPLMVKHGLLSEGNVATLAVLCGVFGRIVQTWSAGGAPQAALLSQYRGLVADLGLSSIAPSAAGVENRFAKHSKRQEEAKQ